MSYASAEKNPEVELRHDSNEMLSLRIDELNQKINSLANHINELDKEKNVIEPKRVLEAKLMNSL